MIFDESHHIVAGSYKKLLDYFTPQFILGMTATPDKRDDHIEGRNVIEYEYPNFHLSMDCFLCEVLSGSLALKEHKAAKWLKRDELFSVQWLPADVTLIEKIKDRMI